MDISRHVRRLLPHRLIALIALAGALASVSAAAAQELLYVASQEDVTVAIIDMGTNELVATVDLK